VRTESATKDWFLPADGTLAARYNDWDFGTSQWQLAYEATATSVYAKAAWIVRLRDGLWPIATDAALTANRRFVGIAYMDRFSSRNNL